MALGVVVYTAVVAWFVLNVMQLAHSIQHIYRYCVLSSTTKVIIFLGNNVNMTLEH